MSMATITHPALLPTQRPVSQPRERVAIGSPTFQIYVNMCDASRNPRTSSYPTLGFLRDEYLSAYGDVRGMFL